MAVQLPLPVVLTRPRAQSQAFAATLPPTILPIISPLIEIVALPDAAPVDRNRTLIFTSANGVETYARRTRGDGQPALCVGDRTTKIAEKAGFNARSAKGSADDVIAMAASLPGPFTHVRGVHTRGNIAPRLRAIGKEIDECVTYDQRALSLTETALAALQLPCIVPLFSPRSAELFIIACPSAPSAHLICMSHAVEKNIPKQEFKGISTIEKPTSQEMRKAVLAHAAGYDLEGGRSSG